jgi:hypothetical protein
VLDSKNMYDCVWVLSTVKLILAYAQVRRSGEEKLYETSILTSHESPSYCRQTPTAENHQFVSTG